MGYRPGVGQGKGAGSQSQTPENPVPHHGGYGLAGVWVGVALEYPRVTPYNLYSPQALPFLFFLFSSTKTYI